MEELLKEDRCRLPYFDRISPRACICFVRPTVGRLVSVGRLTRLVSICLPSCCSSVWLGSTILLLWSWLLTFVDHFSFGPFILLTKGRARRRRATTTATTTGSSSPLTHSRSLARARTLCPRTVWVPVRAHGLCHVIVSISCVCAIGFVT